MYVCVVSTFEWERDQSYVYVCLALHTVGPLCANYNPSEYSYSEDLAFYYLHIQNSWKD